VRRFNAVTMSLLLAITTPCLGEGGNVENLLVCCVWDLFSTVISSCPRTIIESFLLFQRKKILVQMEIAPIVEDSTTTATAANQSTERSILPNVWSYMVQSPTSYVKSEETNQTHSNVCVCWYSIWWVGYIYVRGGVIEAKICRAISKVCITLHESFTNPIRGIFYLLYATTLTIQSLHGTTFMK
jgi:hypothetical protein